MSSIPTSGASAIIVEGGAMRGIFSAGVLDAFLERSFCPFTLAIGSSAGACNLASFLAGQHDRGRRCYMDYMARREFISGRRFLRGGHWVDLDWLWETFEREHPLDLDTLYRSPARLVLAATSVDTGAPVYLEPERHEFMAALKGSCALPILYRSVVHAGGQRLADGGLAAPIPAAEAYRRGARRLLVIRSRPAPFVKRLGLGTHVGALGLRKSPSLAAAFRRGPLTYQEAVSFLETPPADCSIVQIAPPQKLQTGRVTKDAKALAHDYALGLALGRRAVESWSRDSERDSEPEREGRARAISQGQRAAVPLAP
jgi:predicted patatin/cPLA2 family phospholipase